MDFGTFCSASVKWLFFFFCISLPFRTCIFPSSHFIGLLSSSLKCGWNVFVGFLHSSNVACAQRVQLRFWRYYFTSSVAVINQWRIRWDDSANFTVFFLFVCFIHVFGCRLMSHFIIFIILQKSTLVHLHFRQVRHVYQGFPRDNWKLFGKIRVR